MTQVVKSLVSSQIELNSNFYIDEIANDYRSVKSNLELGIQTIAVGTIPNSLQ